MSRNAGGLFQSVRAAARGLAGGGSRVSVFSLRDANSDRDMSAWTPVRPTLLPALGPNPIGYCRGLVRALDESDAHIVHQHGIWQAFSASVLNWGRRSGRPVVISPRGMLQPWSLSKSIAKKRVAGLLYENANLSSAHCLHALNEAEARSFRDIGLRNPIAVIPNGVDLPDPSRTIARPAFLPDDGRKTILFLGRIAPQKGVLELASAWSELLARDVATARNWRLVIAGWGEARYAATLKRRIGAAVRDGHVVLAGPAFGEAKAALFTHADAFVLPSRAEGLPMAVLEAWSYRLPVLMTRACNLETAFDLGAAIEVSSERSELADALARALVRGDLAAFGSRGFELVRKRYRWDRIAGEFLEVYRWCLSGGDAPACVEHLH